MQKYYGAMADLWVHGCGLEFGVHDSYYRSHDVDAALAAKDARIAELEDAMDLWTHQSNEAQAELAGLRERLDEVHGIAQNPDIDRNPAALLADIADLTIGYGPAESHKVVE